MLFVRERGPDAADRKAHPREYVRGCWLAASASRSAARAGARDAQAVLPHRADVRQSLFERIRLIPPAFYALHRRRWRNPAFHLVGSGRSEVHGGEGGHVGERARTRSAARRGGRED